MMDDRVKNFHPAAEWALQQDFDPAAVDCTITVVLKILDGKCKMLEGEKNAIMEIYDVVRQQPGEIFDENTHNAINLARTIFGKESNFGEHIMQHIHQLRVYAEEKIPKLVMKKYKLVLREGLFG